MTGAKKVTIKSLSEEFHKMKEEVDYLKQKVADLESTIENVIKEKTSGHGNCEEDEVEVTSKPKNNKENIEIPGCAHKCRECDKSFLKKAALKMHVLDVHPKTIQCKECEKKYYFRLRPRSAH